MKPALFVLCSFINHRDQATPCASAGSICETTMMLKIFR